MNRQRLLDLANQLEGRDPVLGAVVNFDMCGTPKLDQEIADALGIALRPYTTSIDAALSLTDRETYDYQEGFVNGHVGGTPFAQVGVEKSYADTPALALCAASLRALVNTPRYTYAIGRRDECGAYGIFFGPTPDLQECLDYVPTQDNLRDGAVVYVFEFDGGHKSGTNKIVARWRPSSREWARRP